MTDVLFNPFDPAHFLAPHERLEHMRQTCPVAEFAPGFVFIARDADVREGMKNVSAYSNAGNFEIEGSADPPVVVQLDPPRHTQMRLLLQNGLNPRVFKQAEPFIARVAAELVRQMASQRQTDLMQTLAAPLPMIVLSHVFGVPEEQYAQFCRWGAEISANTPFDPRRLDCWQPFQDSIRQMIAERRDVAQAPEDFISRLMQAEVEGARLTDDEIRVAVSQLMLAGIDPVTSLIGSLVYQLLRRPGLWQKVFETRALVPQAIEETLRYDAPLMWLMRTCTHANNMQGVTITPGARVLLGLDSANRDETVWANPGDFSLERTNVHRHLSFGYGIHFCLGAELARLEARIALEMLLDHFPTLHLAADFHYEQGGGAMTRRPKRLDVCW